MAFLDTDNIWANATDYPLWSNVTDFPIRFKKGYFLGIQGPNVYGRQQFGLDLGICVGKAIFRENSLKICLISTECEAHILTGGYVSTPFHLVKGGCLLFGDEDDDWHKKIVLAMPMTIRIEQPGVEGSWLNIICEASDADYGKFLRKRRFLQERAKKVQQVKKILAEVFGKAFCNISAYLEAAHTAVANLPFPDNFSLWDDPLIVYDPLLGVDFFQAIVGPYSDTLDKLNGRDSP